MGKSFKFDMKIIVSVSQHLNHEVCPFQLFPSFICHFPSTCGVGHNYKCFPFQSHQYSTSRAQTLVFQPTPREQSKIILNIKLRSYTLKESLSLLLEFISAETLENLHLHICIKFMPQPLPFMAQVCHFPWQPSLFSQQKYLLSRYSLSPPTSPSPSGLSLCMCVCEYVYTGMCTLLIQILILYN